MRPCGGACLLLTGSNGQMIAFMPALWTRLLGISLASFSSGLGELTFLQLSTRYGRYGAGRGVGWFSSGTGAAGLVGSLAWWLVRPLGVKLGLSILTILPILMGFTYSVVLPSIEAVESELGAAKGDYEPLRADEDDERESEERPRTPPTDETAAILAVSPHASLILDATEQDKDGAQVRLSLHDKMQLIKPMLFVYILPLVLVYFFE